MTSIAKIAVLALIGLGFVAVVYFLGNTYLKNDAIDKCLAAGRDQFERDGHTLTGPDGYWYNYCLEEKGIK